MDRVIGLDASLNSTGYAYTDYHGNVHTGLILPKKIFAMERLLFQEEAFADILNRATENQGGALQLLTLEDYAMGQNRGRTFSMGELGGVLKLFAYRRGIPILLVPPASLKIFLGLKGNAPKEEVIGAVADVYGYRVEQDDQADAFGLMKLGEAYLSGRIRGGFRQRGINGCTFHAGMSR